MREVKMASCVECMKRWDNMGQVYENVYEDYSNPNDLIVIKKKRYRTNSLLHRYSFEKFESNIDSLESNPAKFNQY
jgi:hypothetical protein